MNKLEMAHDYAMQAIDTGYVCETELLVKEAWRYADLMQAEADKREEAERQQKRKEIRELLNADNTFVEKDGQHFDDVEWQPDWSQAPERAVAYTVDDDGFCAWHFKYPVILGYGWTNTLGLLKAPSFGYNGHWQDSLRKRPE